MLRLLSLIVALAVLSAAAFFTGVAPVRAIPGDERGGGDAGEETDPLGANAACYVCHIPFVKESLSRKHLREKITCTTCHGVSAGHANDEEIGATPPDETYERSEVNGHCRQCHESHDVKPEKVVALFLKRGLTASEVVCTDCHGTHRIERAAETGGPGGGKIRAILWVGGFAHDFEKIAEILSRELPGRLPVEIEVVRDGTFLDRLEDGGVDVLIFSHCIESVEGVLTDPQRKRLLDRVRGGLGVVALHASYYSFVQWDAVHELFGARFIQHGSSDATLVVDLVDRRHPITRGIEGFEITSELYESTPLADDCQVLAKAHERGSTKSHPVAWTRRYGRGRVATLLPGHFPEGYRIERFQKLIARSISWAAGRLDPEGGPGPVPE